MIKSRPLSFLVMFLVYAITFAASFVLHKFCLVPHGMELFSAFLILDVFATVVVFIFSVIFRNASVYDPYWSVQPIVIVVAAACLHGLTLFGALILAVICLWGIRLTANWAYTFHGLEHQDWRYTMLKEKTKWFYPVVNFVGIHMIPTLVVYFCVIPAVRAIHLGHTLDFASIPWLVLSVAAVVIQGTADFQMHSFKRKGGTGFIRVGLWKYSRHPNYLGEILMWWGVGLACLFSSPDRSLLLLLGALMNTCLFLFISIPLADNHQARKPGFEEYKKQTRMLAIIPKHA